jgi:hypothetical protein
VGFEPTCPFGHGISNAAEDLEGFSNYLLSMKKHNSKQIVSYTARYRHILESGKAEELLTLSDSKRRHAMEALACYSKYTGSYQIWKDIRERYQLKWTTDDSLDILKSLLGGKSNYSMMVAWLKETCSKLPKSYSSVLLYDSMTGLRPDEACKSISLIHSDLEKYLNRENMMLEHFRYPQVFIRHTKKAYVSLVTESVLKVANECEVKSYKALRSIVKRQGLEMHMAYCRKIFATHLRTNGVEQELIDLLQGRTPKTVFAKYYYRPDFDFNRIRRSIDSLHDNLAA